MPQYHSLYMLSNVLSGSNIFGVTVTLWDFSNLMQNSSAKRARLIWNKVPHKKYKNSSTVLWETFRRVQEEGKHNSILYKRSNAQGASWSHRLLFFLHSFVWSYSELFLNFWPTAGGGWPHWTINLDVVVSHESFLAALGDATSPLCLLHLPFAWYLPPPAFSPTRFS